MTRTGHTANYDSASTPKPRLLEIVVLLFESGDEMVIHAKSARKQYWDLLP